MVAMEEEEDITLLAICDNASGTVHFHIIYAFLHKIACFTLYLRIAEA